VERRIFGLETEYGITCTLRGQRRLTPDETARYLFRSVVAWGRSSNVFLENGGRLYLDVGSHPEFASPECDSIWDVVRYDRAGDQIIFDLVLNAEARLRDEGIRGNITIFKNNTDSAGNSYGCHENFLVTRAEETNDYLDVFIPFLVTRQIFAGAGKILSTSRGQSFSLSQRAEHIWEDVSSATTRSRPIINTRDEPHADAETFRRLHVIVGDSNMSQYATFLKVGSAACVLKMLETPGFSVRDLTLENPIRAIREVSSDITCRQPIRLANGKEMSALDIQKYLLSRALEYRNEHGFTDEENQALSMWEETLHLLEHDFMALSDRLDWVAKLNLLHRYETRHGKTLSSPEAQMIDLQYHDINPERGLFFPLENSGLMRTFVSKEEIDRATASAPSTTRAHLRGRFITAAKQKQRDYTVDWVHLKLNDQSQRTVVCNDPFQYQDERVDQLIEAM
jgi:proteasome accessory factor A